MATGFGITCVNKSFSGRIVRIGGEGWSLDIHEAILRLVSEQIRFTVMLDNTYFDIGIRGEASDSYLVLEPDGTPLHEIASIPSC